MNKYKVYVYAICKNEEKHIKRWYESMKEADDIFVLDTGSTDESVKLLKSLGIHVVSKKYEHFTFDEARNDSLDLVPLDADICVCTDLDEVLSKDWRKELEKHWKEDTTIARYNMNFAFNQNGRPTSTYYISKMHKRDKYRWSHKIHEVLEYIGDGIEQKVTIETLNISHYPDRTKDRSSYLDLLEAAVKENPENDRDMHYLGREYMYNSDWNKSIDTLIRHLNLKSATWREERGASMRFISRGYIYMKRYDEAIMWLEKATQETPDMREPYIELGMLYYNLKKYNEAIDYLEKGIAIREKSNCYINEEFAWNDTPYDILSLCYYYIGDIEKAIDNITKALELNPKNERLKENKKIFEENKRDEC